MTDSAWRCNTCGRVVVVDRSAPGFPYDAARARLVELCAADGHLAMCRYRAGDDLPRTQRERWRKDS